MQSLNPRTNPRSESHWLTHKMIHFIESSRTSRLRKDNGANRRASDTPNRCYRRSLRSVRVRAMLKAVCPKFKSRATRFDFVYELRGSANRKPVHTRSPAFIRHIVGPSIRVRESAVSSSDVLQEMVASLGDLRVLREQWKRTGWVIYRTVNKGAHTSHYALTWVPQRTTARILGEKRSTSGELWELFGNRKENVLRNNTSRPPNWQARSRPVEIHSSGSTQRGLLSLYVLAPPSSLAMDVERDGAPPSACGFGLREAAIQVLPEPLARRRALAAGLLRRHEYPHHRTHSRNERGPQARAKARARCCAQSNSGLLSVDPFSGVTPAQQKGANLVGALRAPGRGVAFAAQGFEPCLMELSPLGGCDDANC
ncbi:hypothetical protein BJ912DRAFT_1039322 [Pholiota molesta]|nr:hypothetical protein BJ912DRAFT_1039322 [Pholiota molesta]